MKINSKEAENVILSHGGSGLKFTHVRLRRFDECKQLEPRNVEIEFEDIYEIESVINVLQEFERECKYFCGRWERNND